MVALALLGFIGALAVVAVALLKQFDKIAGRGPKQVADGIRMERERRKGDEVRSLPNGREPITTQDRDCYGCAFAVFEVFRDPNTYERKPYKILAACSHEPMTIDPGIAGCAGFVRHD